MSKRVGLIVLLLVPILASIGFTQETGVITGTVTDAKTGKRVQHAWVILEETEILVAI